MPSSVRIVKLLVPWEDDMDDVAGAFFVHRAANEQVNPWNYDKLQDTSVYTLSFTKVIHMLWNMCLSQCAVLPFNFAWHVQLRNVLLWHANIAPPWVSCFFRGKGAEVHVEVITHGNPGLQIVGWAWKWSGLVGSGKHLHPSFKRTGGYMGRFPLAIMAWSLVQLPTILHILSYIAHMIRRLNASSKILAIDDAGAWFQITAIQESLVILFLTTLSMCWLDTIGNRGRVL